MTLMLRTGALEVGWEAKLAQGNRLKSCLGLSDCVKEVLVVPSEGFPADLYASLVVDLLDDIE